MSIKECLTNTKQGIVNYIIGFENRSNKNKLIKPVKEQFSTCAECGEGIPPLENKGTSFYFLCENCYSKLINSLFELFLRTDMWINRRFIMRKNILNPYKFKERFEFLLEGLEKTANKKGYNFERLETHGHKRYRITKIESAKNPETTAETQPSKEKTKLESLKIKYMTALKELETKISVINELLLEI